MLFSEELDFERIKLTRERLTFHLDNFMRLFTSEITTCGPVIATRNAGTIDSYQIIIAGRFTEASHHHSHLNPESMKELLTSIGDTNFIIELKFLELNKPNDPLYRCICIRFDIDGWQGTSV